MHDSSVWINIDYDTTMTLFLLVNLSTRGTNAEIDILLTTEFFLIRNQSHYREVPRWEIFMEQELRFGPVGITEKKIGPIMSNF